MRSRRLWWTPAFYAMGVDIYKNLVTLTCMTTVKQLREFLATLPDDLSVEVAAGVRGRGYNSDYTKMVPLDLNTTTGNFLVCDNVLELGET